MAIGFISLVCFTQSTVLITVTYNTRGQVQTIITSLGSTFLGVTKFSYDHNPAAADNYGYLLKVERTDPVTSGTLGTPGPLITMATFTYDSAGRVQTATDESNYLLTYTYDAFDRVTLVTHPDNTTQQMVYTDLSLTAQKDRANVWTRQRYNKLGQMVGQQDEQGRWTLLEWCKCGALSSILDPAQHVTRWKRDEQGCATSKTSQMASKPPTPTNRIADGWPASPVRTTKQGASPP